MTRYFITGLNSPANDIGLCLSVTARFLVYRANLYATRSKGDSSIPEVYKQYKCCRLHEAIVRIVHDDQLLLVPPDVTHNMIDIFLG